MQISKIEPEIISLAETESTNQYVKELLATGKPKEGTVVVADFQTRGRGQKGNGWHSQKGENLLFSLLIYPSGIAPNRQFIISRVISLALLRTLGKYADGVKIKWPNDIYIGKRKIAGILIENSLLGRNISDSIIGVGLNVNQTVFPEDLPNPISLRQLTSELHDRSLMLSQILACFFQIYDEVKNGDSSSVEDEYLQNLFQIDEFCSYKDENGRFEARITDVQPTGHLVMRTRETDEERIYAFKEVEFVF